MTRPEPLSACAAASSAAILTIAVRGTLVPRSTCPYWAARRAASGADRLPAHTRAASSPRPWPTAALAVTPSRSSQRNAPSDPASVAAWVTGTGARPGKTSTSRPPAPQETRTPGSAIMEPFRTLLTRPAASRARSASSSWSRAARPTRISPSPRAGGRAAVSRQSWQARSLSSARDRCGAIAAIRSSVAISARRFAPRNAKTPVTAATCASSALTRMPIRPRKRNDHIAGPRGA